MNKSQVCERPGWTAARVEKFLVIEHARTLRGFYGKYVEYEYSLSQILEVEKSAAWRNAAAKYLKIPPQNLDARIADLLAKREIERVAAAARAAALEEERNAKRKAEQEEIQKLAATVRGGLQRIGYTHPLADEWRTFTADEVLEYVDMADRRGAIDGDYVREFYRLWSAGRGYCNPKGVLRRLIAPVKNRLVRILLYLAHRDGWAYGVGADGAKKKVLYFDTPFGQASFHLMPFEGAGYPSYPGTWSGVRNSDQILIQLFDSIHGRKSHVVAFDVPALQAPAAMQTSAL
jgi:hypothetical protein